MAKRPKMLIDGIYPRLSKRELYVFKRLIEDAKGKEIAFELALDEKTVSTYKLRICQKLKLKGTVGMFLFNQTYALTEITLPFQVTF